MTSHLEREIHQQPDVIRALLAGQRAQARQIAAAIRAFDPAFVCIAARGTSDNAARYAQYLFATHARLLVALATPSVHTLYESAPNLSRALVIGISQSGQSGDIRRVLSDARAQGALTVSITNDAASPLASLAQFHLDIGAGPEKAVAATKTYTGQLTAVALLVSALIEQPDFDAALAALPEAAAETLALSELIPLWVERYRYMEQFAVLGRGYNYCTAFEISLKVKELNALPGEGYSEADFRHGPIAVIQPGFPVIVVAPAGKTFSTQLDLLQKLHAKQAECLVITNETEACRPYARKLLSIPALPEWLTPVAAVIPGQLFAMNLAAARGLSLDQPVGLTKVTNTY
jgi:glucosamine--fructose-6-phosphate aminotransferase (isomerizing)